MDSDLQAELATIEKLVEAAEAADRARPAVLWVLNRMPLLYQQLLKTYESRYVDEIVRLVTGMRQALTRDGAPELAEADQADRLDWSLSRESVMARLLARSPGGSLLRQAEQPVVRGLLVTLHTRRDPPCRSHLRAVGRQRSVDPALIGARRLGVAPAPEGSVPHVPPTKAR